MRTVLFVRSSSLLFGGRGATLEISPAPGAGCWFQNVIRPDGTAETRRPSRTHEFVRSATSRFVTSRGSLASRQRASVWTAVTSAPLWNGRELSNVRNRPARKNAAMNAPRCSQLPRQRSSPILGGEERTLVAKVYVLRCFGGVEHDPSHESRLSSGRRRLERGLSQTAARMLARLSILGTFFDFFREAARRIPL
jgi:hypothetical protein